MKRWARLWRLGFGGVTLGITLVAGASPAGAQGTLVLLPDDTLKATREAIFSGLANQVGTLPNPTGGGFVFRFDPTLGVFTRATDSFGPVFANRSETTGRGKLTLTTSYSRHTFDELDGVNLRNGDLNGTLAIALFNPDFVAASFGLITIREEVDADVFTLGGLYGVTDQIDVGLTVPIVHARVKERVNLFATGICLPVGADIRCGNLRPANVEETHTGEQTGIGDLVLRGKYNFWQAPDMMGGRAGLAFALDVKLPTGDKGERSKFESPYDQIFTTGFLQIGDPPLGTGIVRVRPQLVASGSWFGVAPHVNVGAELGRTQGITNDLVYEVGFDYTLFGRATASADLLGRHAFDVDRREIRAIGGPDGTAGSDTLAASFGIKVNPVGTLLVFLNFLIPVNDTGLRDDVTPTFGLEWTW
jgi:hypothetical protein